MEQFLQLTITGLTIGAIYALIGLGFVLIYKASDVINFAQGDLLMVGAYITFAFIVEIGLPWTVGVLLALVSAVVIGMIIERFILRPLIGEPIISVIMVTIGLSSLMQAIIGAKWGAAGQPFPPFIPAKTVLIGETSIEMDRLIAIILAAILLIAFSLFFQFSRHGIAMRATADDQQAALSMGISVKTVFALAWSIAAATAVVGGILVANIIGVGPELSAIGLHVFPVVILGGLDSIPGAIVGGIIIGLLEYYVGGYVGGGLSKVIPFIVLILILMVKPYGLFGEVRIERV